MEMGSNYFVDDVGFSIGSSVQFDYITPGLLNASYSQVYHTYRYKGNVSNYKQDLRGNQYISIDYMEGLFLCNNFVKDSFKVVK